MHMPTGSCIPAKPHLVTICGAAGAGKSVLARAVAAHLGAGVASRVPTDYFFVPRQPCEPLERYLARPLAWEWDLLRERLALPVGTAATTPEADFAAFFRIAESGGQPMPIRPVMLLDAMAPYPDADIVVRVDVPAEVRRARIVERDTRWGTRVQDRWDHLELTWRAVHGMSPHVVLDGTRPLEENVEAVAKELGKRWANKRRDGR